MAFLTLGTKKNKFGEYPQHPTQDPCLVAWLFMMPMGGWDDLVDRNMVPRREGEELEPVLVNQSINAQSFRKRMTKKSEVEYLRQLGAGS